MRDNRGTVALEFALIGPPLFLLMMGIMDLGRYYFTAESLRNLVATAARAEIIATQPEGCGQPSSQLMANIPLPSITVAFFV
jgi:Flp pilus assembly protein TadG